MPPIIRLGFLHSHGDSRLKASRAQTPIAIETESNPANFYGEPQIALLRSKRTARRDARKSQE